MAFTFIPMELFKIQGFFFFMQGEGGSVNYSIVKVTSVQAFWMKNRGDGCFVGCEVIVYSVVNDVATDMM